MRSTSIRGQGGGALPVACAQDFQHQGARQRRHASAAQIEPSAFVTEMFQGDGTTTIFQLSEALSARSKPTLLSDSFDQPDVQHADLERHRPRLALGFRSQRPRALPEAPGSDGQTTLAAIDQVELGGTLVLEAANVQLAAPSDGVLLRALLRPRRPRQLLRRLQRSPERRRNSADTLRQRNRGRNQLHIAHRTRLHAPNSVTFCRRCSACCRPTTPASTARSNPSAAAWSTSPVSLVFDLIDLGNASNTPATVLYDARPPAWLRASPAACTFAAVNSLALTGSIGSFSVTQAGSAWVVSTLPGGATAAATDRHRRRRWGLHAYLQLGELHSSRAASPCRANL